MVKWVKIHATPRSTGLPWGLSLAAGIAVVIMTFGSQMAIYRQPTPLAFPGETGTLKVREMSVDILSGPQTSVMAGKQGDTDSVGMDPRSPENTFLPAPARGGGTWTQRADMPTARTIPGSAVVNGKIYVIGGAKPGSSFIDVVEEYNPATNTWTRCADMPTARQGLVAAAVDGIVYAIGGWYKHADGHGRGLSTVEAYDPATDKWTAKASMPTERDDMTASVVDGKIYVIGGMNHSEVEVYDPATDKWTKKANMSTARCFAAACVIDGHIYVSGGNPGWPVEDTMSTVEVYDPATDTWTQVSDMPRPRAHHTASLVDGKMYIIGGGDDTEPLEIQIEQSKTVEVYDPGTDTWTTAADHPTSIGAHTAAVVDGKIYTIGGSPAPQTPAVSTVYEYEPGLPHAVSTVKPERKVLTTWGAVK